MWLVASLALSSGIVVTIRMREKSTGRLTVLPSLG
jgi:hypothetical protein